MAAFLASLLLITSVAHAQSASIEQRFSDLRQIASPPLLAQLPSDQDPLPPDWLGVISWNVQVGGVSASPTALRPTMVRSALGRLFGSSYQILAAQEVSSTANAAVLTGLLPGGSEEWLSMFSDTVDSQDNGFWLRNRIEASAFSTLFVSGTTDSRGRRFVDVSRTTHPPVVASFRVGDFDFTMLSVHLTFSEGQTQESAREFRDVLDYLDSYFGQPGHDPDVIICGDFNIPTRLSGQTGNQSITLDPILESDPRFSFGERRLVATVHEPTSRSSADQGGLPRNSYDHFILSIDTLEELIQARRVDPGVLLADPDDPEARLTSDHFPVVALFRTTGEDVKLDNEPKGASEITSIVNGASFQPGIAAGSWITLFGTELAATTRVWRDDEIIEGILPKALDGVGVLVNGKPAATFFLSPGQLNIQAPDDEALGPVLVEVQRDGVTLAEGTTELRMAAPGLFAFDPQGRRYLAAVHPDGVLAGPQGLFGGAVVTRPVAPGEVVLLFGTGFGPTEPPVPSGIVFSGAAPLKNAVRVLIGGMEADVLFAGISGAGVNQLNVRVPENAPAGDVPVIAETLGFSTQEGTFLRIEDSATMQMPTVSLIATPPTIQAGQSATLQWMSSNASTASINQGIGAVALSGSLTVSPTSTTTYTITATGQGGTTSQSATVTVTAAALPTVTFTASPSTIAAGQSLTLQWTSSGANMLSIDYGIGSVGANGSVVVLPGSTTVYTITATGPGGETKKSVTVTVTPAPAPTVTLTASPPTIQSGKSSTLQWTSKNASSLSISQGIGSVSANGSLVVSPLSTTIYTITATGPGGTTTQSATVTVTAAPAPTVSFTVLPSTVQAGQSATLQWTTNNATSVLINQGIGSVSVNGSKSVTPAQTTTYTLTAQGPGGSASASVTVLVSQGSFGPCGSKTTCGQMNSCAEARHFLNVCKVTRLDADHDGVPCESICPGG